jgi:hypothetical protein
MIYLVSTLTPNTLSSILDFHLQVSPQLIPLEVFLEWGTGLNEPDILAAYRQMLKQHFTRVEAG